MESGLEPLSLSLRPASLPVGRRLLEGLEKAAQHRDADRQAPRPRAVEPSRRRPLLLNASAMVVLGVRAAGPQSAREGPARALRRRNSGCGRRLSLRRPLTKTSELPGEGESGPKTTVKIFMMPGEQTHGVLIVFRDISEDRRLEVAKESILKEAVEDLRSPLSAMLDSLRVLKSRSSPLRTEKTVRDDLRVLRAAFALHRGYPRGLGFRMGARSSSRRPVDLRALLAHAIRDPRARRKAKDIRLGRS